MRDFIHQHEKHLIIFTGCILIPAAFLACMLIMGYPYDNLTGLLNDPVWRIPSHIVFLLMLTWLCFCLYRIGMKTIPKELVLYDLGILALLSVVCLFLPYEETSQLISGLHIVAAYSAFIWMNIIFWRYIPNQTAMRNIYLLLLLFALLHSLTRSAVTGLSEVVIGIGISVMISLLCART